MVRLLLIPTIAVLATGVQAQVYKCVDSGGKTVYSQSPCPAGSKSSAITKTAPPAAPVAKGADAEKAAKAAGPKTAAELEQDFRKRRQDQAEARKKEDEKAKELAQKEENCRNARTTQISIESGVRQARTNESGERYFLDDAQLEQEKARARTLIQQWCK